MVLAQIFVVFLKAEVFFSHDSGMGYAHAAEVPGLACDAGYVLLSRGVAEDEAIIRRSAAKFSADAVCGKLGADKVYILRPYAQVNGKPGLVLAAAGEGYIFAGKFLSLVPETFVPYFLLPGAAAPAAHRGYIPPAVYLLHKSLQKCGGAALHEYAAVLAAYGFKI